MALSFGYILYPSYKLSQRNNSFISVILTLIAIMAIFSAIVYVNPDIISLKWGPTLIAILIGVIIFSVINMLFDKNYRNPKWLSYLIIILFIFFVMYDTKKIKIDAKKCKESTVDYINASLGIVLDIMNLFQNLVLVKA